MQLNVADSPKDLNPFESCDITAPRLVWDPIVHQTIYHERCSYFLLRLVRPNQTYIPDIERILLDANITSFCVYALYGYYDLLIRFWATDQKRQRFLTKIKPDYVGEVTEFVAQNIRYLWAKPPTIDRGKLIDYKPEINKISESVDKQRPLDKTTLDELGRLNLIHQLPKSGGQRFKVFLTLTPTPGPARNTLVEVQTIVAFFSKAELCAECVSIYSGFGFTDYLVKFLMDSFDKVFELNQAVVRQFENFYLRPTTYLVANRKVRESDHVDAGWREFSGRVLAMDQALGANYAPNIARMPPDEREKVAGIFESYANLRSSPFREVMEDLFGARIRGDQAQLARAMTVLLEFEGYLTAFLQDVWQKELNPESRDGKWYQTVRAAAEVMGLKDQEIKKPTLKTAVDLTNKLISLRSLDEAGVVKTLGDGWRERIAKLSEFRNDLAHGHIFTQPSYLRDHWEDVTRSLCEIAPMYNKLSEKYRAR